MLLRSRATRIKRIADERKVLARRVSIRVIKPVSSHAVALVNCESLALRSGINPDIVTVTAREAR